MTGDELSAIRAERGLSRGEFAKLLGMRGKPRTASYRLHAAERAATIPEWLEKRVLSLEPIGPSKT